MLASKREEQRIKRLSLQEFEVHERKRGSSDSRRRTSTHARQSCADAVVKNEEEDEEEEIESVMADFAPSLRSAYTEVTSHERHVATEGEVSTTTVASLSPPPLLYAEPRLTPPRLDGIESSGPSEMTSPPRITRSIVMSDESEVCAPVAQLGPGSLAEVAKESDLMESRSEEVNAKGVVTEKKTKVHDADVTSQNTRRRSAPVRSRSSAKDGSKPRRTSLRGRVIRTPVRSSSDDGDVSGDASLVCSQCHVTFDDWNELLRHRAEHAQGLTSSQRTQSPAGGAFK